METSDAPREASYPPLGTVANGFSASHSEGTSGLQEAIFGPRGITSLTVDPLDLADQSRGRAQNSNRPLTASTKNFNALKPSRWRTPEYLFYGLIFIVIVPYMAWIPVQLSQYDNPNFPKYSNHLKQGWLFGRRRDDSDFQYRTFRDYVPLLAAMMIIYVGISCLVEKIAAPEGGRYAQVGEGAPNKGPRPGRKLFLAAFTAIFVLALHGTNTLKLVFCCALNYSVAKALGGTVFATPAIWTFNIGILFAVHYYNGVDLGQLGLSFSLLDGFKGLLPRWQINYNITMLRLVSFSLDFHWARQAVFSGAYVSENRATQGDSKERGLKSHPLEDYNFFNYLLYSLYPPLFIAGPIMTFNDFHGQLLSPVAITRSTTVSYAIRFVFCLMTMEFILHFMYVNAIKDSEAWVGDTPLQLSMIGFWNLIIVWLKLLIPWRFFRLWAMADGVDAPENMIRCMANNYSTLGFWRSWHRSYNLWIVRYIYVPVGGAKRAIPATLLVFTFVGLWHDLSLKLLTWAWLVSFFIVPELACRAILPEKKFGQRWWYRHVCAVGGVLNVLMMMTANLVGFVIGVDGIKYMWEQILGSTDGMTFLLGACATLFVGVQVMFEYREEELRRGVKRKC
ncbi:MBOAT-domain-containing protein [Tilletiaria anomala UBC 951]|uniref:MBOAT-domain-containing protein n=1 Tax=Tilletiaria anomala (strain ATCC 24038 / CBS 436.72 / UBC 951) TaxID=1037660 RepID=A0A066W9I9_TILAU|nr:MBOAT-domain-containing protein [Tilletiaria anomala UBC 951]KDN47744.1 MBOAT-domain-containing protein [Tilletiaria anomala UBC 951]